MDKVIELGSCLYTVMGAAVVVWGIWRAWARPKDRQAIDIAARRQPAGWSARGELARLFLVPVDMLSTEADRHPQKGVDRSDWQLSATALPGIAMGNNDDNAGLTNNAGNASAGNVQLDILPTEIRDMIRFQAKAEAVADLMNAGIVGNQAKTIEAVFHCARASSSRPESTYQKALGLITRLAKPAKPEYVGDMIARVEREVAKEQA
jgi:hypothetical protein